MDIQQLQYFKTLAELEHMTRAAATLHIAQPALSRTLRSLEAELGLPLFDRVGKHIQLNDNGRILLAHVEVMLGELADAKRELAEQKGLVDQRVSITMRAASKLLPDLIRGFQQKYPQVSLQIMQQADAADRSDITIYSTMEPARGENTMTLMEEEICLALPAANPLSSRREIALADVADQPFICLYKGKDLRTITDEYCARAGFAPRTVLESDSPGTVRDLIAIGVGLSFVPVVTWKGIDDDPNVKLVRISQPECKRYVNMAWRGGRYVSSASRLLRGYLMEFFAGGGKIGSHHWL